MGHFAVFSFHAIYIPTSLSSTVVDRCPGFWNILPYYIWLPQPTAKGLTSSTEISELQQLRHFADNNCCAGVGVSGGPSSPPTPSCISFYPSLSFPLSSSTSILSGTSCLRTVGTFNLCRNKMHLTKTSTLYTRRNPVRWVYCVLQGTGVHISTICASYCTGLRDSNTATSQQLCNCTSGSQW